MSLRPSSLLVFALLAAPVTLAAQRVSADISVGHGPVSGRVVIGNPYPLYHRDVVEVRHRRVYRPAYREVIVVREHRGHGWYKRHGYRSVRIWYDADRRTYHNERPYRHHRGLREVVVYERDGRFYHERDGRGWDRDDRRERDWDRRDRVDDRDRDWDRDDR